MRKKIGEVDEGLIIGGVLVGAAYFFVVRPLVNNFGTDPADTQTVTDQQQVDQGNNPFNPNFTPFLQQWAINQPSGLSVSDGMQQIKQLGDSGQLQPGSQAAQTYAWGEALASALSVWNWSADTQTVISIFNQMSSEIQVAALAAYMSYVYGKDLLTFLHYGGSAIPWIPNGLPESQVAAIVKQVNNLPQE